MLLLRDGKTVKSYRVSTSKFGIGDKPGSNCTPLGRMEIASKIGEGYPSGTVFKSRRPTGEILRPNAPGRDPIVSRILWLKGTEQNNSNAFKRCIYIHGTPEEWRLGSPASYGCIRMGSKDVIDLYKNVGQGAEVFVVRGPVGNSVQTNSVAVASSAPDHTTFYGNN
jgi:lipoprotein-anchoring transpeptidase ErfK/SrfK